MVGFYLLNNRKHIYLKSLFRRIFRLFETIQKLQGSQAGIGPKTYEKGLRPYRNYKVLKHAELKDLENNSLRPYRNYKVLKPAFS